MNASVLQALIAAGIGADLAARLAQAIDTAYSPNSKNASFSAGSSPASFADGSSSDRFALYTSGPASVQDGGPAFGKGKAALGVAGLAVVNGEVYATGDIYAGGVASRGAGVFSQGLTAYGNAYFGGGFVVNSSLSASPAGVIAASPVVCQGGLVSQRLAQLNGPVAVNGPLSILGDVNWKGPRNPAQVGVISFVHANGSNVLQVVRREIAVLNDYGDINGSLSFTVDAGEPTSYLQSATLSTVTSSVAAASGATFTASTTGTTIGSVDPSAGQVVKTAYVTSQSATISSVTGATFSGTSTTQSITVITSVGFDTETCAVTANTTTINVVTDFGGSITLQSGDVGVLVSVSLVTDTASVSAAEVVSGVGGTVTISTVPVSVLSSASLHASTGTMRPVAASGIKIAAS